MSWEVIMIYWTGVITIMFILLVILGSLVYWAYDLWLKRILCWDDPEKRKLIFQYVRENKKKKQEGI